ncbi:unnamed protein product [Prorocentrum cordatum]|uniref:Uncharacterized protein n=1 Tax=Prorocentrum cordatum TaxID=2364126 RepID=A0ABN9WX51_9DINO|nr:unnamed protein product [Polarella glacialis]
METSIGALSEAQTKTYEDMQSMITNISTAWENRFHGLEQRIEEHRTHHESSDEQMEDPEKFSRVQAMIDGKAVKQKLAETEPTLGTEVPAKFHKVSMSYSTHCENDQHAKNLRAWAGMPLQARLRQRTLSRLWPHVLSKLQIIGKWTPDSNKLGVNGARGEFCIIDTSVDDHWVLFQTIEESDKQYSIQPHIDNLQEWGINIDDANKLIQVATDTSADGFI